MLETKPLNALEKLYRQEKCPFSRDLKKLFKVKVKSYFIKLVDIWSNWILCNYPNSLLCGKICYKELEHRKIGNFPVNTLILYKTIFTCQMCLSLWFMLKIKYARNNVGKEKPQNWQPVLKKDHNNVHLFFLKRKRKNFDFTF